MIRGGLIGNPENFGNGNSGIIGDRNNVVSSNVIIHGGTFSTSLSMTEGFDILRQGVSLGAIHDSAEHYPAANCHPDTRKAVRQIILDWIRNESSASAFFWLNGPAGAGKTAILQAIAEFLCSPSGSGQNFGGSFFFSRGKQGRDQGHFLFSTIAYQLALKVPGLRQCVNRIMISDPTLHTKSMVAQLQTLIVKAFKDVSSLPRRSYLVIIDGLDECHDKATQQSILRLLCETITVHKLPLRFLIGSRPESHIRASFDQESLYTITHRVVLDETFDPGRDIQVFLRDGFAKICAENSSIMSHVEHPWPSEGIIDLLVQRSSGQFIYAATVLKFVGADFFIPTKQLELVLKPDHTAFSDLDQLYTQILSVYPSNVNIVHVLGIITASHGELAEVIEYIFELEKGQLKQVLRGLLSLMKDEEGHGDQKWERLNNTIISYVIPHFAHASFSDYLIDSSRSGPFHVNPQEYENQLSIRSFALIIQLIRSWRKPVSSNTRVLHPATWVYLTSQPPNRFIRSPKVVKEAIMTDINDLVQEFRKTSRDGVGAAFFAMRHLFRILQECYDNLEFADKNVQMPWSFSAAQNHSNLNDIMPKFKILLDGYRKMFDQLFSNSKDLDNMLRFLPGVVVQNPMGMQGMACLYRIKSDQLKRLISFTIEPLKPSPSQYKLDDYLSDFLQNRNRSQLYYCDPMLQHIFICRQLLSLLDKSNVFDFQSSHDLSDYVSHYFYGHLCAATADFLNAQNISDDHPALEFLHDLETTAYYVDINSADYIFTLARCIIKQILRWIDMVNVALSVSNVDLMERVCHLTNKIYREMLCIARHGRMMYITMGGLDSDYYDQASTFSSSWTPQYSVLSWDLLAWIVKMDSIPCSFTNFITTQELSGPFYISPDIYHTQITEYSLETIFVHNYSRPSPFYLHRCSITPVWKFWKHLSHALPTEMVFYLLRSIPSPSESDRPILVREHSRELTLDVLEIIFNWLQGLGSERPSDLYDRFQGELLRRKALPQP